MAEDNIDKFWQKTLVKKEAIKQSRYSDFRKEALLSSTLHRLSIERVRNHVINNISVQQEKTVGEKYKSGKTLECYQNSEKLLSENKDLVYERLILNNEVKTTSVQSVKSECNDGNGLQILINENNVAQQIPHLSALINETQESVIQNMSSLSPFCSVSVSKDQSELPEIKLTDLNSLDEDNVTDICNATNLNESIFSLESNSLFTDDPNFVKVPSTKLSVKSTVEVSSDSLGFLKPVCFSPKRKCSEPSIPHCSQSLPSTKRRKLIFDEANSLNQKDSTSPNSINTKNCSELLYSLKHSTINEVNLPVNIACTNLSSQQQPLAIFDTKPIVTSISSLSLESPIGWDDDFIKEHSWKQSVEMAEHCNMNLLNKVES